MTIVLQCIVQAIKQLHKKRQKTSLHMACIYVYGKIKKYMKNQNIVAKNRSVRKGLKRPSWSITYKKKWYIVKLIIKRTAVHLKGKYCFVPWFT